MTREIIWMSKVEEWKLVGNESKKKENVFWKWMRKTKVRVRRDVKIGLEILRSEMRRDVKIGIRIDVKIGETLETQHQILSWAIIKKIKQIVSIIPFPSTRYKPANPYLKIGE